MFVPTASRELFCRYADDDIRAYRYDSILLIFCFEKMLINNDKF